MKCAAGLPVAKVPLLHVAQGVTLTTVWFIVAGRQAVVRWQLSQEIPGLVPPLWLAGSPVAELPLWQVAQVPGVTPVWLNVAGTQAVVL